MKAEQVQPQSDVPKALLLLDLPNEIIDRMCDYLAPGERLPRPVKARHVSSVTQGQMVTGWLDMDIKYGLEIDTETGRSQLVSSSMFGYAQDDRWYNVEHRRPNTDARCLRINDLAAFAATCKQAALRASSITRRRTFILTISNHGIDLEGSFSTEPLQTFRIANGWGMIEPEESRIVKMPEGTLPGNHAFQILSSMIPKIHHLRIYVETDMDWNEARKTGMFLCQIGTLLRKLSQQGVSLPSIRVVFHVDFHDFDASLARSCRPFLTLGSRARPIPDHVLQTVLRLDPKKRNITTAVVPRLSPILRPMIMALWTIRIEQTDLRAATTPNNSAQRPFALSISIQSDRGAGHRWGRVVETHLHHPYWSETFKVFHGSFERFCRQLQHSVFSRRRTAENQMIPSNRFSCRIGFPPSLRIKLDMSKRKLAIATRIEAGGDHDGDSDRPAKIQKVT